MSLAPAYAARAPEAMWAGLPETSGGSLARRGLPRILKALERASAFVVPAESVREALLEAAPGLQEEAVHVVAGEPGA